MKLGEMLVRDGRLTEAQLDQAITRQAQVGGRLGTVLVEMGLLDADAVTVYLGLELGIPIATTATLDRAKRAAVRMLAPDQAARYRCVPLLIQDRQLIAALDDPLDWQTLDELSRLTGYRLVPRVAPEIRIYYYLELLYGVPRPPRLQDLGEPVRRKGARPDLPAPPLPGLPPQSATPVPAPGPAPVLRTIPADDADSDGSDPVDQEALELDAADLVEELDADDDAVAQKAPRDDDRVATPTRSIPEPEPAGRAVSPTDRAAALEAIAGAREREDVASAITGYAASVFDAAVLLMVRDNMAFGWKAHGVPAGAERVDALLIPLDAPSMFQVAIYNEGVFHGRPFPSTLHNYLYKVLQTGAPAYAAVAVIFIGSRVVNLLYGHSDDAAAVSESALEELREVAQAASDAYVRLIAASKEPR